MSAHRPLSAWVARLLDPRGALGDINDGDDRADARQLPTFAEGWSRFALPADGTGLLALRQGADCVVELDDYGSPIQVGARALELIERLERSWPVVGEDLTALHGESTVLRYWLLERLDAEGEPPDAAFAVLPWELLNAAVDSVVAALTADGQVDGPPVEMRHWLTPAVRGLTGPIEQLDCGLRAEDDVIARQGASALLANLRDLPLGRVPGPSRGRLAVLVERLGDAYPEFGDLAASALPRLANSGANAVPDDIRTLRFEALVVPGRYLSSDDPQTPAQAATLRFGGEFAALHAGLRGIVTRVDGEVQVRLGPVGPEVPELSVAPDVPGAEPVRMRRVGKMREARLPWTAPNLPERLVFVEVRP